MFEGVPTENYIASLTSFFFFFSVLPPHLLSLAISPFLPAFGSKIQKKDDKEEGGEERAREAWKEQWAKNNSFQRSIKIGIQSVVERRKLDERRDGKRVVRKRKLGGKKKKEGKKGKKGELVKKKSRTVVERKRGKKGSEEMVGEEFANLAFSSWEFCAIRFFFFHFLKFLYFLLPHSPCRAKLRLKAAKLIFIRFDRSKNRPASPTLQKRVLEKYLFDF